MNPSLGPLPTLDDLPSMFGNFHSTASRSTTQFNSPAVQASMANERNALRAQQLAKGINNPMKLVNLQTQLHQRQITPQQFMQQFGKAKQLGDNLDARGTAQPQPFKITPKTVLQSAVPAAKTVFGGILQGTARAVPEVVATAQQKITGKPTTYSNKGRVGQFLFGKPPIQSIQQEGKGAASSHPGGFHIPGTPVTLTPSQTGVAERALHVAQDLPVVSGLAKTAATVGERGVKTAATIAGKDIAVNKLLSNTRTQQLQKVAAEAEKKSTVGGKAVQATQRNEAIKAAIAQKSIQGAKTKDIPVAGSSTAQRETVGKVAVQGAKTKNIPITEQTSTVKGKASTMTAAQYQRESTKLSKGYDVESASTRSPIAQEAIDTKYRAAQDRLDQTAGKTSVTFPEGRTKTITPPAEPKVKPVKSQVTTTETPKLSETPITKETVPTEKVASSSSAVVPTETVKVSSGQLPVGAGDERTSKLETRMQGSLDNLTDEQKQGLSTYSQMNKKENIATAAKYVDENPDEAMQVLRGERNPPKGVAHNSIFLAMDAKGVDDAELARKLASLRSTRYGQEISLLTEANPHSPTRAMSDLKNVRIEAKGGDAKVRSQARSVAKEIKSNIPKPTKNDWQSFVESLKC